MAQEIARLLKGALESAGLYPRWVGGSPAKLPGMPDDDVAALAQAVADTDGLARTPPSTWHPGLLHVWRLGAIYLRDAESEIPDDADIAGRRVIIRRSTLGAFARIGGDGVLLERSTLDGLGSLEGPIAAIDSRIGSHAALGPMVHVTSATIDAFVKAQRWIWIERSQVGSHTSLEGQSHPEKIPLGAARRAVGVHIGPDAWVGAHVAVTAGVSIGAGAVVAPFSAVTHTVPDHTLAAGTPARVLPIDHHLRNLSPSEARAEGRARGAAALELPVYGARRAAWRGPEHLEIDYAGHGSLRALASENLLHFQAGVLEAALGKQFAGHRPDVRFALGESVRFAIRFDPPVPRESGESFVPWDAPALPPFQRTARTGDAASPAARPADDRPTMEIVKGLLRALLETDVDFDVDTPFYALGVDSLTAADLAGRIEDELAIEPPDVFVHNTVRLLSAAIDRCRAS